MIATLGPEGTFSELACKKYKELQRKEHEKNRIIFCKNIKEIFDSVNNGKTDIGIAPLENLLDGSVGETLDLLYTSNLNITGEIVIAVHHCIAGLSSLNRVKTVISHSKALGQCLEYIRKHNFDVKEVVSTAEAMLVVSAHKEGEIAAIGPVFAAQKYGLKILDKNIEDNSNNVTRFIVISKSKSIKEKGKKYKTGIAIHPLEDRPGLLYDLLKPFAIRNINLTKIESRPTKITLGGYIFYVDLEGYEQEENIKSALEEVKKLSEVKIFGSYERAL